MVSRWRITTLLSLCLVGTIACGFSTWIWSESNSASTGEIEVGVGDIKTNEKNIIYFQEAKLFTLNRNGFEHQEIMIDETTGENIQTSYFDYQYQIESIWKIAPCSFTSFSYSIVQGFNPKLTGSDKYYNYLKKTSSAKMEASVFLRYENGNLSQETSEKISIEEAYDENQFKLECGVEIPKTDVPQYVVFRYSDTISIPSGSSFEDMVYVPSINVHNAVNCYFDFSLNRGMVV